MGDNFTLVSPGYYDLPQCTASSSLPAGSQCSVGITLTPTTPGPLTGAVIFTDNNLNGNSVTQEIQLSGVGLNPPPTFSANPVLFGNVSFPGTVTKSLTITNVSASSLTLSSMAINGPSFAIQSSTCTAAVPAGHSCTLQIKFSPVTVGPHEPVLTMQGTQASASVPVPEVALYGVATGVGTQLEGPLQFGSIPFGTTEELSLTITNYGVAGTVTIGTSFSGPSFTNGLSENNTCLAGIKAGQSCLLPIRFAPASVGLHGDYLYLTPSGGAVPTKVSLSGIATSSH